jgi:hypothetical protein
MLKVRSAISHVANSAGLILRNTSFRVSDKYLGSIAPARRTAILMLEKRPDKGFCIPGNDRVSRVVLISVKDRALAVYSVSGQRRKSLRIQLEKSIDNSRRKIAESSMKRGRSKFGDRLLLKRNRKEKSKLTVWETPMHP